MNSEALVKKTTKIMYGDEGVSGTAQYLSQLVWILFLKVFDYKEEEWELDENYVPVIPKPFRFRDWADPKTYDGKRDIKNQLTGSEIINFVNNKLFPFLKGEEIEVDGVKMLFSSEDKKANIVREFMKESVNYMKNGVYLRQVINEIADIDFDSVNEKHEFNDFYEKLLKELQNAGKAGGEFYTPRAITKFMTDHVNPQIGETIADFACGTGGFLAEATEHLQKQAKTIEDNKLINQSIYGIEWKQLPYMLATTNLLLHNIENPKVVHGDGLSKNVLDLDENDLYNCILMNPPFGGHVDKADLANFPTELASAESADLFVTRIIYCLKENGRCGLILPDGLLFDPTKINLKKKLLQECNLHTVIRLPKTVFSPYTDINTNLLFFDKNGPTKDVWFYRMDMPEGQKRFNKTYPITRENMKIIDKWWDNRVEILDEKEDESLADTWKSKKVNIKEIINNNYNLDYCGFPQKESVILSPEETVNNYIAHREMLEDKLSKSINELKSMINGERTIGTSVFPIDRISKEIAEINNNFSTDIKNSILQAAMQGHITQRQDNDSNIDKYLEKVGEKKNELIKNKIFHNKKQTSKIEEGLFDIPESWRWVMLGDIVDFRMGKTPARTDKKSWGNDYKWVSISDMRANSIINQTSEGISEYGFKKSFNSEISPKGTLVMSFKLTIGKVSILDIDALHNEAIISIFPIIDKDNILRNYLFKILPFISKYGDMKTAIKGNTLNSTSLNELYIPLPPLEEQDRIVKKLEELLPIIEEV